MSSLRDSVRALYVRYCEYLKSPVPSFNVYGQHFSDCVWSNSDTEEGPDTCSCAYFYMERANLREKVENCCFCEIDAITVEFPEEFLDWLRSERNVHG